MAEQFDGLVTIAPNAGGIPMVTFDGINGDITVGGNGRDGDIILKDGSGAPRIVIDAQNGRLILRDSRGNDAVLLDAGFGLLDLGADGNEGDLRIRDNAGRFVFAFDANFAVLDIGAQGNEGDLRVHNDRGDVTIHLDGNEGDIKLSGADLAEDFSAGESLEPGSVVVAVGADEVELSRCIGDRRVVGVVSGAADLRPGLRLGTRGGAGRVPVAVAGRAWCKADADQGEIEVGDLLMTSPSEGYAMRAGDAAAAFGAIIGKALAGLASGRGLIPVLLTLG